jgi:hypothetical protein
MTHPSSPDAEPAIQPRAAYDAVWKDKGWKLAGTVDGNGDVITSSTTTPKETK